MTCDAWVILIALSLGPLLLGWCWMGYHMGYNAGRADEKHKHDDPTEAP